MSCLSLLNATESLIEEYVKKNKDDSKEEKRGLKFYGEEGEFIKAIYKHVPVDFKTCKVEESNLLGKQKFKDLDSIARAWNTLADAMGIFKSMAFVDLVMLNVMTLVQPYSKGGSIYPILVWNTLSARIGEYLDLGQPMANPLSIFGQDSAHSFICSLGRPEHSGLNMLLYMYGKSALSDHLDYFDDELEGLFMEHNENTNENGSEFMKRSFKEVENRPVPSRSEREYLYSSLYPIIFGFICRDTSSDEDITLAADIFELNRGYGVTIEMVEDFSRLAWSQFLYTQYAIACLTNSPDTKEFADQVIRYHKREGDMYNSMDVFINLQAIRNFINKD